MRRERNTASVLRGDDATNGCHARKTIYVRRACCRHARNCRIAAHYAATQCRYHATSQRCYTRKRPHHDAYRFFADYRAAA